MLHRGNNIEIYIHEVIEANVIVRGISFKIGRNVSLLDKSMKLCGKLFRLNLIQATIS